MAPLSNAHQLLDETTVLTAKVNFANEPYSWVGLHVSCDGLVLAVDKEAKVFFIEPNH